MDLRRSGQWLIGVKLERNADGRREFRRVQLSKLFFEEYDNALPRTILVSETPFDTVVDRLIRPPDYSIKLSNITKDFATHVELIDCKNDDKACARHTKSTHTGSVSSLHREGPLTGVSRRVFGELLPNNSAIQMTFEVKPSCLTYRTWKIRLSCGMTADSKLGFGLLSAWDHDDRRMPSLIPWNGSSLGSHNPLLCTLWTPSESNSNLAQESSLTIGHGAI